MMMVGKEHFGLNFLTSSRMAWRSSPSRRSTSTNSYKTVQSLKSFLVDLQWLQVLKENNLMGFSDIEFPFRIWLQYFLTSRPLIIEFRRLWLKSFTVKGMCWLQKRPHPNFRHSLSHIQWNFTTTSSKVFRHLGGSGLWLVIHITSSQRLRPPSPTACRFCLYKHKSLFCRQSF